MVDNHIGRQSRRVFIFVYLRERLVSMEGHDDDQLAMWEHYWEATAEEDAGEDAGEAEILVPEEPEDVLLPAHGEADPGQAAMLLKYQGASSYKQAMALEHESRQQVAKTKPKAEAKQLMKKLQREVSENKPKSEAQLLMKKLKRERYKGKRKEKLKAAARDSDRRVFPGAT